MPYSYRVSTNAIKRIKEAATYLEVTHVGYGFEFDLELQECIDQLCGYPESGVLLYENKRRAYLKRFKYHVIYSVHHDRNEISAAHSSSSQQASQPLERGVSSFVSNKLFISLRPEFWYR